MSHRRGCAAAAGGGAGGSANVGGVAGASGVIGVSGGVAVGGAADETLGQEGKYRWVSTRPEPRLDYQMHVLVETLERED